MLTGRVITWTSGNTSLATVNSSGLVTGVAAGGPVTITATSEGQGGTSAVTVTAVPVASRHGVPGDGERDRVDRRCSCTATTKDANGNVLTGRVITWASSNPALATVNASGLVTGVAAGGPVTITATSEGQSGTAAVTVTAVPVASVTVAPATASVTAGQTVQLTATTKDAERERADGPGDHLGLGQHGARHGECNGLVTRRGGRWPGHDHGDERGPERDSSGDRIGACRSQAVTVAPNPTSVVVGGTAQLTATTKDANGNVLTGRVITWASSNTSVATVDGNGVVTGVAAGGPVTITATSEGQSGHRR